MLRPPGGAGDAEMIRNVDGGEWRKAVEKEIEPWLQTRRGKARKR